MDKQVKLEIVEKFFDYCNAWKVESDIRKTETDDGTPLYEIFYTAEIQGVKAQSHCPFVAMKKVLDQIQEDK